MSSYEQLSNQGTLLARRWSERERWQTEAHQNCNQHRTQSPLLATPEPRAATGRAAGVRLPSANHPWTSWLRRERRSQAGETGMKQVGSNGLSQTEPRANHTPLYRSSSMMRNSWTGVAGRRETHTCTDWPITKKHLPLLTTNELINLKNVVLSQGKCDKNEKTNGKFNYCVTEANFSV